jgi:hypothetical protein
VISAQTGFLGGTASHGRRRFGLSAEILPWCSIRQWRGRSGFHGVRVSYRRYIDNDALSSMLLVTLELY